VERLGPIDATFYHLESKTTPMHVGSVSVMEGPAPRPDEVTALLAAKLPRVPRYRQRVRTVPLGLGRPVWIDDQDFRVHDQVRHVVVPAPGGDEQLLEVVAKVVERPLDMAKPLWEVWLLDGLVGDRWAIVAKVHHCMVDGIAGTDLLQLLFDREPDGAAAPPTPWQPSPQPSTLALIAKSLSSTAVDLGQHTLGQLSTLPRLASPAEWARRTDAMTTSVLDLARRATVPTARALNGPLGRRRRWAWTDIDLKTVRQTRRRLGGAVNDVVLAAITAGLRDLLAGRDQLTDHLVVRTLVPISLRRSTEHGQVGNRIATVLVDLPVGDADPLARFAAVRRQMDDHKRLVLAFDTRAMLSAGDLAAPALPRGPRERVGAADRPGRGDQRARPTEAAVRARPANGLAARPRADRHGLPTRHRHLHLRRSHDLRYQRRVRRHTRCRRARRRHRARARRARGPIRFPGRWLIWRRQSAGGAAVATAASRPIGRGVRADRPGARSAGPGDEVPRVPRPG
jgi:diacylglycerol O-acyltransferase